MKYNDDWFQFRYLTSGWITGPMLIWYAKVYWAKRKGGAWFALYALLGIPFVVASGIYNATVGWYVFWDRPRHWQFTDRLQEYDKDPAMQPYIAEFKRALNRHDPGHV